MSQFDDRVIPYEDAVRRRRALEDALREKGVIREVGMSDAMSHLLEKAAVLEEAGPTPAHLRHIVERELAAGDEAGAVPEDAGDGSGEAPSCELDERRGGEQTAAGDAPHVRQRDEEAPRR